MLLFGQGMYVPITCNAFVLQEDYQDIDNNDFDDDLPSAISINSGTQIRCDGRYSCTSTDCKSIHVYEVKLQPPDIYFYTNPAQCN